MEISSLYTSVPRIMVICYTVPEIWRVTDVIAVFHLGNSLPFYLLNSPKNENFKKKRKKRREISSFYTIVPKNYDYRLHCSWDMARDRFNCYFSFWAIFCPFTPPAKFYFLYTRNKIIIKTFIHFDKLLTISFSVTDLFHKDFNFIQYVSLFFCILQTPDVPDTSCEHYDRMLWVVLLWQMVLD